MSLKASDETVRIDFGDGDWAEIRKVMRRGDTKFAQDSATLMPGGGVGSYNSALLARMIVAWSLPDEISIATVDAVDDNAAALILQTINTNNRLRSAEETAPLDGSSNSPSELPGAAIGLPSPTDGQQDSST